MKKNEATFTAEQKEVLKEIKNCMDMLQEAININEIRNSVALAALSHMILNYFIFHAQEADLKKYLKKTLDNYRKIRGAIPKELLDDEL